MKTRAEAMAWIRKHRIALQAAKVGEVPSLAQEIVHGPIRGSWWSHPKGKLIFALATHVTESGEVLAVKLIEGKTTYVHRELWPALLRVVLDGGWRAPRVKALGPAAKKLFEKIERDGEVHGGGDAKALEAVEESLLALVVSQHTEKGHHEKVLTSWARWAEEHGVKRAAGSLEDAIAELRSASHGADVLG